MTRKIRALYLQPAPLFGGAERQAAIVASLLPELGIEVIPMVGPGNVVVEWLRERGVRDVIHSSAFPGGWAKQRGLRRLSLPWRYVTCGLRARREILEAVSTRNIDIIVASLPFAWFVGSLVARSCGIPIVWRAGGARINVWQKVGLWLVTRFLRPELLLCTAEAVRKTFAPFVPAPSAVVPNGVEPGFFMLGTGEAARYRPPGARCVVGCAMRLTRAKRPEDFLMLAARLRDRFPDTRFLLAGNGSRRGPLELMARRVGADNLSFLGFVADMPSFFAACDVVVLPSGSEGCPNVVLEAMAMGKPVVAADVPPVLELVGASNSARVYPLGDVAALSAAVEPLIEKREERRALALRGYIHALRRTARVSAARLAYLMRSVVGGGVTTPTPAVAGLRPQLAAVQSPPPVRAQADTLRRRIPLPDPPRTG